MQVHSKSLLWSMKTNILCCFKCWHKPAQIYLILFGRDSKLLNCDEFWYYNFVKGIVNCNKGKLKTSRQRKGFWDFFMSVKIAYRGNYHFLFMLITNLAFNILINLILIDKNSWIYKQTGKLNFISSNFSALFYVYSCIRLTETFHINRSSESCEFN